MRKPTKARPKAPINEYGAYRCPICGLATAKGINYCIRCGQRFLTPQKSIFRQAMETTHNAPKTEWTGAGWE